MQFLILIILLSISIYAARQYWALNEKYQKIVDKAVYNESESTPQNYKGIESLILSYLNPQIYHYVQEANLNEDFAKKLKELEDKIHQFKNNPVDKPSLLTVPAGDGTILTDRNNFGFLFLPVNILRKSFDTKEINVLKDTSKNALIAKTLLLDSVYQDKNLMLDIAFTKFLTENLQELTHVNIFENSIQTLDVNPSQVYIITKNGINRIFSSTYDTSDKATEYYGQLFPNTTFFPSRPYFWPTFKTADYHDIDTDPNTIKRIDKAFYVSRPYMDLAGNGFVVTLAKGIEFAGVKAVICFDIPLIKDLPDDKSKTTINAVLDSIKTEIDYAKVIPTQLILKDGHIKITDNEILSRKYEDYVNRSFLKKDRAEALGNIQVFGEKSDKSDALTVSIPTGNVAKNEDEIKKGLVFNSILLTINLGQFRSEINKYGITTCISFASLIFFFSFFYGSTIKRSEEFELAFKQVDSVMDRTHLPYCRLNSKDCITEFNPAFCEALGYNYKNMDDYKFLYTQTFSSLCADLDSKRNYQDVEKNRIENKSFDDSTFTYKMNLKCNNGSSKKFVVISGQYPSVIIGQLPETFGVLIDPQNKENLKFIDIIKFS